MSSDEPSVTDGKIQGGINGKAIDKYTAPHGLTYRIQAAWIVMIHHKLSMVE